MKGHALGLRAERERIEMRRRRLTVQGARSRGAGNGGLPRDVADRRVYFDHRPRARAATGHQ